MSFFLISFGFIEFLVDQFNLSCVKAFNLSDGQFRYRLSKIELYSAALYRNNVLICKIERGRSVKYPKISYLQICI